MLDLFITRQFNNINLVLLKTSKISLWSIVRSLTPPLPQPPFPPFAQPTHSTLALITLPQATWTKIDSNESVQAHTSKYWVAFSLLSELPLNPGMDESVGVPLNGNTIPSLLIYNLAPFLQRSPWICSPATVGPSPSWWELSGLWRGLARERGVRAC